MKYIPITIVYLIFSSLMADSAYSYYRPKTIIIQEKNTLDGFGGVYNSNLIIEEKPIEIKKTTEKDSKKEKEEPAIKKIYKAWIRSCGTIELPEPSSDKNLKSGDRIKVRLQGGRSCIASDWEKF